MPIDLSILPDEVRALITAQAATIARQQAELDGQQARIALLRAQLAKLRRLQFGRPSEKLDTAIAQLELTLEDLEEASGGDTTGQLPASADSDPRKPRTARRPFPQHLPRDVTLHQAACVCPACGGTLRPLGEDVTEVLDRSRCTVTSGRNSPAGPARPSPRHPGNPPIFHGVEK